MARGWGFDCHSCWIVAYGRLCSVDEGWRRVITVSRPSSLKSKGSWRIRVEGAEGQDDDGDDDMMMTMTRTMNLTVPRVVMKKAMVMKEMILFQKPLLGLVILDAYGVLKMEGEE